MNPSIDPSPDWFGVTFKETEVSIRFSTGMTGSPIGGGGLEAWVRRSDQVPPPKAPLTAEEVMNPSKPVLRDQQPKSGSQGDLKKWMEQFDVETQQTAKKILEMLADHKYSKAKLQNAAAQYGLNVQDSLKYQPKSLQQVIAYAAAMSS